MAPSPPWSLLPTEILDLIFQRLSLPDCFTFHKVCQSWRSVFLERRRLTRPPPCLAVSSIVRVSGKVYSLHGDQLLKLCSPELKLLPWERIVGSSMGWLVIVRNFYLSHLLNPISNERIPLPSFDSGCIYHVALSTVPTSTDCILVVSACGPHDNPIYAWCRLSDSKWTSFKVDWHRGFEVCDMMFHQGKLHVVVDSDDRDNNNGEDLYVYNFDQQPKLTGSGSITNKSKNNHRFKHRLVQSGGELLLVRWHRLKDAYSSDEDVEDTNTIDNDRDGIDTIDDNGVLDVFKQADEQGSWLRVDSLGDRVLLMNKNRLDNMESFSTQDLMGSGFQANCIYFLDIIQKHLVKFSMGDGNCQQISFPRASLDDEVEWIVGQAW